MGLGLGLGLGLGHLGTGEELEQARRVLEHAEERLVSARVR